MENTETCERMDAEQIKIEKMSFLLTAFSCLVCALFFSFSAFRNLSNDSQDSASSIEMQLQNRINPNTAQMASLIRLPNVGLSKATAIIDYRRDNSNIQVFKTLQDLQKVKGIGSKTVEQLEQYLTFEQNDNGRMGNK